MLSELPLNSTRYPYTPIPPCPWCRWLQAPAPKIGRRVPPPPEEVALEWGRGMISKGNEVRPPPPASLHPSTCLPCMVAVPLRILPPSNYCLAPPTPWHLLLLTTATSPHSQLHIGVAGEAGGGGEP